MSDAARIPATGGDDIETAQLRAAIEEAEEAEQRGEVVPHERVRTWLLALAEGKRPPPPVP